MPMQPLRFDRDDHSFFKHDVASPPQHRFLLMEPGPHAVPDERRGVIDPMLLEFLDDERVDLTGRNARATTINRLAVHVQRQLIPATLLQSW